MINYPEMYKHLFQSQTQAIEILQKAQQATEEMYMNAEPTEVKPFTLLKNETETQANSDEE